MMGLVVYELRSQSPRLKSLMSGHTIAILVDVVLSPSSLALFLSNACCLQSSRLVHA